MAFVIGKARVAQIKRMTIPNLELQAAVYGAQLAQFVKDEMDIEIHKKIFGLIVRPFCIDYGHLRFVIGCSLLTD